jgi:glycosyltransferase involved in cell wall biosynthesis
MPATVLHLNTERGFRGGEIQTLLLARGLSGRGWRSVLAVQEGGELALRAAAAGLTTVSLRMRGEIDLPAARRLAELVRRERIDLLHYHTAHAVTLGTLASFWCGRRPAIAARRVSFRLRGRCLGRLKYALRVDKIVAVSEAIRRSLIAQGVAPGRVVVVHSGIEAERFMRGDRSRFRSTLRPLTPDWPAEAILVGTAAHLAPHKGLDRFLEAAALAAREVPAARFVIVGSGPEEERLKERAARLGLSGRVIFTGFRDDMPDVYAGLDLFALASLSGEGSPAVLKEAMAAGVPVAATALDGVEEIVEDGRHGLLVPPGNAPALGRAIVLLASDPALRARLASEAASRVRDFSSDRMIEGTEAVYRAVLGAI